MKRLNYNQIRFLKSAHTAQGFPPDTGAEVAFGGRSNAGKSSALNKMTNIVRLAKTSKTPGRTQLINFFELDETRRLVDLPGYGFAKVPVAMKAHWETVVSQYLTERESLKGFILLMDIRHPLKPMDIQMIEWAVHHQLPTHILLTKADKLARGARHNTLLRVEKALSDHQSLISVQLFSALSGEGIDALQDKVSVWLE